MAGSVSSGLDNSVVSASIGQNAAEQVKQYGEQWEKNLTIEERAAFHDYTGTAYMNINAVLRGIDKYMHPDNVECANILHKQLKHAELPQDCVVYRGTSAKALGLLRHLPDKMLEGRTFIDEGFMSTSLSRNDAFTGEIFLEIEAPKGSHGVYVGYCSSAGHYESEVLFDAGQSMRIKNVRRDENGRRIIRVVIIQ